MKDFTKGKEAGLLLKFSLPLILGNFFENLYNIVDSIIVGNFLGKEALGAVGASFPIIFALISLVIGIGSGASTIVSQYFGATQTENVRRTIDTVFIFFFIASIFISILGIIFSNDIFYLLKLPEEMMSDANNYLRIYIGGIFFFFGFAGLSSILRGLGDSKTPLYFMIASTIVNILLDLLFVMVFHWGIKGVAWATVLSEILLFVAGIVYLNIKHPLIKLSLRKYIFDISIFKSCIRIGLPTGIQQSLVAIGMMTIMGIINSFGTNAVAAYTAAMRIDSFAKMPAMTFSSALSSFVGQNLGAFREDRAKNGLKFTIIFSLVYSVVISTIIILFGGFFVHFFTSDQYVIEIGKRYLVIVSSFYLLLSIMFTLIGFLRGAGATLIPMFVTIASLYFLRIPAALFLSNKIGVDGVWWSFPLGWAAAAVFLVFYYFSGKWKGKTVISREVA